MAFFIMHRHLFVILLVSIALLVFNREVDFEIPTFSDKNAAVNYYIRSNLYKPEIVYEEDRFF